jgi:hypothetical protein
LTTYPWLGVDDTSNDDEKIVYCKLCRSKPQDADKKSPFFKGAVISKTSAFQDHQNSQKHSKLATAEKVKLAKPGSSQAEKACAMLDKQKKDRVLRLLNTAHAVVMHNRPFTDFPWMIELQDKNGLDMGATYRNDMECKYFTKYIAEAAQQEVIAWLNDAHFYSVMMDGSTNTAIREIELLYIRAAKHGVVRVFLVACSVVKRPNSESILASMLDALQSELHITATQLYKHLVGFSADGAAVNFGVRNGVATKLLQQVEWLIAVHCVGHRVELALRDQAKDIPYQKTCDELLLGLYLYYHNSSSARSGLLDAIETLQTPKGKPTRVGGTRWVEHTHRAVGNLIKIYPAICAHLTAVTVDSTASVTAKGKANGYLRQLSRRRMVIWLHFLLDVLSVVKLFSKLVQKEDCLLSDIAEMLDSTTAQLEKLKDTYGPNLSKLLEGVTAADFTIPNIELTGNAAEFERDRAKLLDSCIRHLNSRFKDLKEKKVVAALSVFNINTWPLGDKEALKSFGNKDIQIIYEHFQTPLSTEANTSNMEQILQDWDSIKISVDRAAKHYQTAKKSTRVDSMIIWQQMWRRHEELMPGILTLVDLVFSLQAQSAVVERGFSLYKLIHSDIRNGLLPKTVTDLMRIRLHTEKFEPMAAFELWNSDTVRGRRPDITPYGPRKKFTKVVCLDDLPPSEPESSDHDTDSDSG